MSAGAAWTRGRFFWKDARLENADSLSLPDEIAAEIVENLQAALEAFQEVAEELQTDDGKQEARR